MGYQPLEELLPRSGFSIYKLARLASIRATELADGKPPLIPSSPAEKTATIALEEVWKGKVELKSVADNRLTAATRSKDKSKDKGQSVPVEAS